MHINRTRPATPNRFSGVAPWLLLACLAGVGSAQANERSTERLTIGQEVRAEITSADRLNYSDGTRSKLYRFSAKPGELVAFRTSGALKARLAVHAGGEIFTSNLTDGDAVLSYRVESAEPHVLAVSGVDHRAYGPFRLSSETRELYAGGVLTPDISIDDWFNGQSRDLTLQVEREGLYQIDLMSDEFDTLLELTGQGRSLSNDDGGEGTHSRLITSLSPGRYTLRVTSYNEYDAGSGLYQLSVNAYALAQGMELQNEGTVRVNGPEINGLLEGATREYQFQVEQRQLVTIDMRSDMFDSFLELRGHNVTREDDDGGGRLNARIRAILEPGTYQISARGAGRSSNVGLFQLEVSGREVPENSGGGPLVINQRSEHELLLDLPNRHTFSVREAGPYVIDMISTDVDSYLRLFFEGDEIAEDDDGGSALNARIERRLAVGDYVLEASALDGGDGSGSYRIEVRQAR